MRNMNQIRSTDVLQLNLIKIVPSYISVYKRFVEQLGLIHIRSHCQCLKRRSVT